MGVAWRIVSQSYRMLVTRERGNESCLFLVTRCRAQKSGEIWGVLVALGYLCTHSTYIRFLVDILSILVDHTVLVDLG